MRHRSGFEATKNSPTSYRPFGMALSHQRRAGARVDQVSSRLRCNPIPTRWSLPLFTWSQLIAQSRSIGFNRYIQTPGEGDEAADNFLPFTTINHLRTSTLNSLHYSL